jgi:hypothetical protein
MSEPTAFCYLETPEGCPMNETVGFNDFVRRQTPWSSFSHWTVTDEEVLARSQSNWDRRKPGYRDGVVLVPVDPEGFFSSIVILKDGDKLEGIYEPRRPGEAPRKRTFVPGVDKKTPAKSVDIVLYSKAALAEDGEEPAFDWNIISVNAGITEDGNMPMSVGTLLANHFHVQGSSDGGTSTGMTAEELVEALRVAYEFWKDKAMVG